MPNVTGFRRKVKMNTSHMPDCECEYSVRETVGLGPFLYLRTRTVPSHSLMLNREAAAQLMAVIREVFPDVDEVTIPNPRMN